MNAITIPSLLAFLSYLGIGIAVLAAAITTVALVTPHRDITLIRQGNVAAAVAFGGALIGLALPLHSAISHSVSLADAAIWGAIAAVAQLLAFVIANVVGGNLSRKIADKDVAAGILSATVSIAVGLINAAAMTP
ncbi:MULTISPECIES: DUF350 domain-containing protein [Stenotrophomonas]|uniref:DUF350 domain-containing protein n=1 Tax=Stenotrophomonas TaxID=40323 RepID=UPI0021CA527E|nr:MULTISPECIES: DUF350 domain-containing protein [Stenotrophomonas]MCU1136859.1 DUF350 domain-containing protein [Stenotrophomonas maltophilia]MEC4339815.1 DUF350 domain-containing protein [Stenotrophomonas pavanii]